MRAVAVGASALRPVYPYHISFFNIPGTTRVDSFVAVALNHRAPLRRRFLAEYIPCELPGKVELPANDHEQETMRNVALEKKSCAE